MSTGNKKISRSFQNWLLLLVATAFLATTAFLWIFQTNLALDNTVRLLKLNISDVRNDIKDASDENLLMLTAQIAADLNNAEEITDALLTELTGYYDVTEINCINADGVITASTYPGFLNYEMSSGEQSAEFLVLLNGESEYVRATSRCPPMPPFPGNMPVLCWKRAALFRWAMALNGSSGISTNLWWV